MVAELVDPRRVEPPLVAVERVMLDGWLDYQRTTLLLKCDGLGDEQRKRRPVATSLLSLHGLVRHMTDVERNWFQRVLGCRPGTAFLYWNDGNREADLTPLDGADWDTDLAAWRAECEASREAAAARDLDDLGVGTRDAARVEVSLRWIFNHMIEEYARHNGHADLIREMIDGAVGY
ncbi:MAG: DinB family protein [Acidimicrobiales bacterium]